MRIVAATLEVRQFVAGQSHFRMAGASKRSSDGSFQGEIRIMAIFSTC